MKALKLPDATNGRFKPFDLSSFRPGGASHLLNSCEDSEDVRRRGRWATTCTVEIYLQEVLYVTYMENLPKASKEIIGLAASGFPDLLQKAKSFSEANIPCSSWYHLLKGRLATMGANGRTSAAFGATSDTAA